MTELPAGVNLVAWIVFAVAAAVAARFYGSHLRTMLREGGEVRTDSFRPADFGAAAGLTLFLIMILVGSAKAEPTKVAESAMIQSAMVFLAIIAVIYGRFWLKTSSPREVFGFQRVRLPALPGRALFFFVAALPLFYLAAALATHWLGNDQNPQEIVQYFRDSVQNSDRRAVLLTSIFAVLVAPFCEETIFRGYIYGAFKRFVGPKTALLVSAGLFAAVHQNASAFGPLFILALCLSLAYEATGSLAVPMLIHAFFNGTNLVLMYALVQATGG